MKHKPLEWLVNGTVIRYRKKLYFVSKGLGCRILTCTDGHWKRIHELRWKSYTVVFNPSEKV